ncbi:hypothetical protein MFLAVUS_007778 [Mucor flavus]|uniref:Uncharacterized protein n=1 Tax=Mucor flavus TaxID=439312 RepID=A0ABP9Z5A3_9FUNG
MSSLANLINSVKAKTANNVHLKNNSVKRKAPGSKLEAKQKKQKTIVEATPSISLTPKRVSEPNVVVFDPSVLYKKPTLEDKASKKKFLDSRITTAEPSNVEQKNKPTAKDAEEEVENQKHDVELKQLLSTSNLLEELEREEMTSRDKRKSNMKKLETLGAKASAAPKMPLFLKLSLDESRKQKGIAKLQEAKDLGIYDKSLKHLYVKTDTKTRDRNPGITNGLGRLKGATLTIKKSDIERIKREGSKKKSFGGGKKGGKRKNQIKRVVSQRKIKPNLVGFLANDDPAAKQYAEHTASSCKEIGLDFKLVQVDKDALKSNIIKANSDKNINGIMVYYPVFGNHIDYTLRNSVDHLKDIEGLAHNAVNSIYHDPSKKKILPCTPLAIIKILEYIGQYKNSLVHGDRLKGCTVTIINRSEIAGRPLAAILAKEGAIVYSVDKYNVQKFTKNDILDTDLEYTQVVPKSDIVITGVPDANYKLPSNLLKPGVIAINFSTYANFESDITSKASYFVPSVGKVTVAMLKRNLLKLYDYQNNLNY